MLLTVKATVFEGLANKFLVATNSQTSTVNVRSVLWDFVRWPIYFQINGEVVSRVVGHINDAPRDEF